MWTNLAEIVWTNLSSIQNHLQVVIDLKDESSTSKLNSLVLQIADMPLPVNHLEARPGDQTEESEAEAEGNESD